MSLTMKNATLINPINSQPTSEREAITIMVDLIGVPKNLKGYKYLIDAIQLCVNDRNLLLGSLKNLYNLIAEMHTERMENIKTSIERALERAWFLGSVDMFKLIFGYSIKEDLNYPSVKRFLFLVTKKLLDTDEAGRRNDPDRYTLER